VAYDLVGLEHQEAQVGVWTGIQAAAAVAAEQNHTVWHWQSGSKGPI
jgi:hypothetical protein